MAVEPFIAVDWGTSNRRAYLIDGGVVERVETDTKGCLRMALAEYPDEVAALRARHNGAPVLAAGMIGSSIGWCDAGYVPAPASLADLARSCRAVSPGVHIVPGVSRLPADVMRGEEVQFLGAQALGMVGDGVLLCQPGTHAKWAVLDGRRLASFHTAMTGELFEVLSQHGTLSRQFVAQPVTGTSFLAGVAKGATIPLLSALFSIRAEGLVGNLSDQDAASFASGVLIGSDVAANLSMQPIGPVYVLADGILGESYTLAIEALGRDAHLLDAPSAFVAGMIEIWRLMP